MAGAEHRRRCETRLELNCLLPTETRARSQIRSTAAKTADH